MAYRFLAKSVNQLDRGFESIKQGPQLSQEALTGFSQSYAPRRAIQ